MPENIILELLVVAALEHCRRNNVRDHILPSVPLKTIVFKDILLLKKGSCLPCRKQANEWTEQTLPKVLHSFLVNAARGFPYVISVYQKAGEKWFGFFSRQSGMKRILWMSRFFLKNVPLSTTTKLDLYTEMHGFGFPHATWQTYHSQGLSKR